MKMKNKGSIIESIFDGVGGLVEKSWKPHPLQMET